jgi:hypothetical protein
VAAGFLSRERWRAVIVQEVKIPVIAAGDRFLAAARRKQAILDKLFTKLKKEFTIHVEDSYSDATNWRASNKVRSLPSEVTRPPVAARVEKRCQSAGESVSAGNIRPFIGVAERTNIRPTKLTGMDPLNGFR